MELTGPTAKPAALSKRAASAWHVQRMGKGPGLLMLHGTGASTHSWELLEPLLARRFQVVAPDLPGHGFTTAKKAPDLSLPGMARSVGALAERARLPTRSRGRTFGRRGHPRPALPRFDNCAQTPGQPQWGVPPFRRRLSLPLPVDGETSVSQSAGAAAIRMVGGQRFGRQPPARHRLEDRAARRRALRPAARQSQPCRGRAGHDGELGFDGLASRPAGSKGRGRFDSGAGRQGHTASGGVRGRRGNPRSGRSRRSRTPATLPTRSSPSGFAN